MKKLMIVAAIVCAAAMSQAVTVNWGCDSTEWQGGVYDGTYASYGATYSLYLVSAADLTAMTDVKAYDKTSGALTIGEKSFDYIQQYKPTDDEIDAGYFATSLKGTPADDLNGNYLVTVIYDPEAVADKFAAAAYMVSGLDDAGGAKALGFDGTGDTGNFAALGGVNLSDATPQDLGAVPEPTSGLLLLIGVAGLALRRRRA